MNQTHEQERQRQIAERAAGWLLILQARELTAEERGQYIDWMRASPEHVAELIRAAQVQRLCSHADVWSNVELQTLGSSAVAAVGPWSRPDLPRLAAARPSLWRLWAPRSLWGLGIACCTAVLLIVVAPWEQRFETGGDERRQVKLEDGSVIDLAPSSSVRISFSKATRSVRLNRGEALFQVAKNAQRPFMVAAQGTNVRAVGTAFDVGMQPDGRVSVRVVEGRVSVTHSSKRALSLNNQAKPVQVSVGASEEVLVSERTGEASEIRHIVAADAIVWTTGQMVFSDEAVADVARRFNQYNGAKIEVRNPELSKQRVSGNFSLGDPESFVESVRSINGLPSAPGTYNDIRLVRGAAAAGSNNAQ
jgi:transmembrane sensor